MKILLHSNAPWIRTGYGQQTAIWAPRLAALGHEVIISGPFSFAGSPMGWGDFMVLPGAQDPFGSDVIAGHYERNQCDILITLCDVFMMDPDAMKNLNVAHWLPVDCEPMGTLDAEKARASGGTVIAMSKFGERMMRDAGFNPSYIPHGIDTQQFSPAADRAALREELGFDPEDFLIGLNAANKDGPRKGIAEQMIAFAEFHERHPRSKLLIHSFAHPAQGLDLKAVGDWLGITQAVMLPDAYAYACGLMDSRMMANWYRILDLQSNCSYGEGFGLPVIEAQACGTPVAVTNASSMPELCGAGWQVGSEKFWVGGHNSGWAKPLISEIVAAYEKAYQLYKGPVTLPDGKRLSMYDLRSKAREFALAYDADLVLEKYWQPVLEQLEDTVPRTKILKAPDRVTLPEIPDTASSLIRDLLLIVPSRGRPDNVSRLIDAVSRTSTAKTDIIFAFDDDDPKAAESVSAITYANANGMKDRVQWVQGPRKGLAAWTNLLAADKSEQYHTLGSFGDDHVPETAGWDTELVKATMARGPGFAYPNDLVRPDIPQAVVASSEIVKALGWMCEPTLEHFFVDNVWSELGKRAGCISYLPDVVVEHVHHIPHAEVERDSTYRDAEKKFSSDKAAFDRWRAERMTADAAAIRGLRKLPVTV